MNARRINGIRKTIERFIRVHEPATQQCAYHVARRLHSLVFDMERRTPCETSRLLLIAIKNL